MTMALKYSLISGSTISPTLFFFLKVAEAFQGLLWFHINFWYFFSSSVKCAIVILIRMALNVEIALGNMNILMMLNLYP